MLAEQSISNTLIFSGINILNSNSLFMSGAQGFRFKWNVAVEQEISEG